MQCIFLDELSLVMLCLLPQEYVDNPLYVEQVEVVDEATKSANQPAADNSKVRHRFQFKCFCFFYVT